MSKYIFETIGALHPKQRDVIEGGNLKEGAVFFRRHFSGYILSLSLAVFFAVAGLLAIEQILAMPQKFGSHKSGTQYFFIAIFLCLGIVAFSTSSIFCRSGWRDLQISRKEKNGSFDFGLRLDATGLLAKPAVKGKPFSCIYVPLKEIDHVQWEAKGRTVSGDRYRTIDHYARLHLKNRQIVYFYLNSFEGDGVDLAAEIGRWAAQSNS